MQLQIARGAFGGGAPDTRLGYGVMVTLQILVLPFLVRVRVSQHNKARS